MNYSLKNIFPALVFMVFVFLFPGCGKAIDFNEPVQLGNHNILLSIPSEWSVYQKSSDASIYKNQNNMIYIYATRYRQAYDLSNNHDDIFSVAITDMSYTSDTLEAIGDVRQYENDDFFMLSRLYELTMPEEHTLDWNIIIPKEENGEVYAIIYWWDGPPYFKPDNLEDWHIVLTKLKTSENYKRAVSESEKEYRERHKDLFGRWRISDWQLYLTENRPPAGPDESYKDFTQLDILNNGIPVPTSCLLHNGIGLETLVHNKISDIEIEFKDRYILEGAFEFNIYVNDKIHNETYWGDSLSKSAYDADLTVFLGESADDDANLKIIENNGNELILYERCDYSYSVSFYSFITLVKE